MIEIKGPRVLVKPEKVEDVDEVYKAAKAAGIALIDSDDKKREDRAVVFGTVLQTTLECWQPPVGTGLAWVQPGDRVVFARYSGKYIVDPTTREEFLILNDEDIIGVIK